LPAVGVGRLEEGEDALGWRRRRKRRRRRRRREQRRTHECILRITF